MNYLSVCSGIEAATVAWHSLGWNPVAFSEIEPFPCKVLAHHYQTVPNWGDMTKFKEWPDANINVLVGGTPCQSFSIAGLRKGLDDPRGNLMLTYLAIAAKYRPTWVVWENVPGVLSSNGGKDFGTFLAGLGECGYGFAYRVLDAQFVRTDGHPYAVPQRRRRVFVVGCLGDWRRAAAVLFDSESLRGNPPPSREAGQAVAGTISKCSFSGGAGGRPEGAVGNHFLSTRRLIGGFDYENNAVGADDVMGPLMKGSPTGGGRPLPAIVTCMAHGQGGAEITEGYAPTLNCNHEQPIALVGNTIGREPHNGGNGTGFDESGAMYTLTKTDVHAVAYSFDSMSSNSMKSTNPDSGCNEVDVAKCLDTSRGLDPSCNQGGMAVAFSAGNSSGARSIGYSEEHTPPLRAGASGTNQVPTVVFAQNTRDEVREMEVPGALAAQPGMKQTSYLRQGMQVRRLTPLECERLQGFPDNYTNIPGASDSARYKALGNSMAVNVMQLIGQRIQMVENIA